MMFAVGPHQLDSCHSSGFYEDCSAGKRDVGWKRLYVMPPLQWHHRSTWLSLFLCCPSSWFHSENRPCLCKRLLSLLLRLWKTSKKPVVKMMFLISDCGRRCRGCRKGRPGSRVAFVKHALVCTLPSLILTVVSNLLLVANRFAVNSSRGCSDLKNSFQPLKQNLHSLWWDADFVSHYFHSLM